MRTLALTTGLTLAVAAVAGTAGLVAAAFIDTGSAVVIAAVVALGLLVIGLIEWAHRRQNLPVGVADAERRADLHTRRALDELRSARPHHADVTHRRSRGIPAAGPAVGAGHGAVSHALRSV